jgi:hypothetical protein
MRAPLILITLNVFCLVVLYYVNYWDQAPDTASVQNDTLLSDFRADSKALTNIEIVSHDGVMLRANLSGGEWVATHLSDEHAFPLNQRVVNNLVSALVSSKIREEKTKKAENYPVLHVEEVSKAGAQSRLVTLETSEKSWQVIVGKQSEHKSGTFVRLPTSRTSLFIDKDIELPEANETWLQQPILDIVTSTLAEIAVIGRPERQFLKSSEGEWNLPSGVAEEVANLTFDSVLPRSSALLNWIIQTPSQQVKISTIKDSWLLSFYRNEESNQIWLTLDHDGEEWQENWAFSVSDFLLQALLTEEQTESEVSSF